MVVKNCLLVMKKWQSFLYLLKVILLVLRKNSCLAQAEDQKALFWHFLCCQVTNLVYILGRKLGYGVLTKLKFILSMQFFFAFLKFICLQKKIVQCLEMVGHYWYFSVKNHTKILLQSNMQELPPLSLNVDTMW